jgi:hypothetical protein
MPWNLKVVDIYCADLWMWSGTPNGPYGSVRAPVPSPPPTRPDTRNIVPTIGVPQRWSATISDILSDLKRGDCIGRFFMLGHGSDGTGGPDGQGGQFRVGEMVKWYDDGKIAEFQRLRPFTSEGITYAHILGCMAAADGACIKAPMQTPQGIRMGCFGNFASNTGGHGYQLLSKLAWALGAPVTGTTQSIPISLAVGNSWEQKFNGKLTVGPEGGWSYQAFNELATSFGP